MANVIITADDYGLSYSTNKAIKEAISKRIVKSTNVMVNMDFYQDALSLKDLNNEVSIGIHFNLTTGRPVTNPIQISSIVDSNGFFFGSKELKQRINEHRIVYDHICLELNNQLKLFNEKFGAPDYWNSHENIHMNPFLFKHFLYVAKKGQVYKMRNHAKYIIGNASVKQKMIYRIKNFIICIFMLRAKIDRMKMPNYSLLFIPNSKRYEINSFIELSSNLNGKKTYEFYVHPSTSLDSEYFGNIQEGRVKEYNMLTNPQTADKFLSYNINIVNFDL